MSSFKQLLDGLTKAKAPGPAASFFAPHLLLALERIAAQPIGRNKLAEELGIGEGVARTLIERLRNAKLIDISKTGCFLTPEGQGLFEEYKSVMKKAKVDKNELTLENFNYAVLVRNCASKVKTGIEQRDAAITAGAKSATTLVYRKGHLSFPSSNQELSGYLSASSQIENVLRPREEDAIIIVGSDKPDKAEYGVLAAALTLLGDHD